MLLKKRFTIHLKKKVHAFFQIPNYDHSIIKLIYSLLAIVDFGFSNIYNLGLCQICSCLEKFLPTYTFIKIYAKEIPPVNRSTDNCRYSINRFNSITFLCLSQTRTGISNAICCGLFVFNGLS